MFFVLEFHGGSTNSSTLVHFGANDPTLIIKGEWWRLITSMFLHIGIVHLLLNTAALLFLGGMVERIFGSARFLIIYLLAGLVGALCSFLFTVEVSAGASGAIYGCFGAILYIGVQNRTLFFQTFGPRFFILLSFNLAMGFAIPNMDMGAHMGGLVGGFLAALFVQLPHVNREKESMPKLGKTSMTDGKAITESV